MNKKRICFILHFNIFIYVFSLAQTHKICGYVIDSISHQAIPYANINELINKKGISSDADGYFELNLKKHEKLTLEVSHIEYIKKSYRIELLKDTLLSIILQPKTTELDDIVIFGATGVKHSSNMILNQKQINAIPSLVGEKDAIKALQYSPGVLAGNEGTIGFSVRVGGQDQNLYLIDNMPIYSPAHLLGFFSTFNPDIIQQAELLRAGMPANYGGKLSSLVSIKTKKPSFNDFVGSYSLGLISAKAYAEIPIIKSKSGLMISARRSYFDV
jgi:hypothetical protein